MNHVEGKTVRELCRFARDQADLPVELVVKIISLAAMALHAIHEALAADGSPLGRIHGLLRPNDILVSREGEVTVSAPQEPARRNRFKTSYHYLPPEQLDGRKTDRRADVFALTVILQELLTGSRPFDAPDDVGVIMAVLKNPPRSPKIVRPEVDDELEAIISRGLAKDPEQRTRSCEVLRSDLEQYLFARGLNPTVGDLAILITAVEKNAEHRVPTPNDQASADDVHRAQRTLAEGLPGRNDPYPVGTGGFDNAELRHALAGAAFIAVLHSDPSDAFDTLARYFEERELVDWFGKTRAGSSSRCCCIRPAGPSTRRGILCASGRCAGSTAIPIPVGRRSAPAFAATPLVCGVSQLPSNKPRTPTGSCERHDQCHARSLGRVVSATLTACSSTCRTRFMTA